MRQGGSVLTSGRGRSFYQGPRGNQHGPRSHRLTPWGHQDLAVDGAPADGVDIHGSQVAPEVVAGVVLKAFVPEQHSVPWKEEESPVRAGGGHRASRPSPFSSGHWTCHCLVQGLLQARGLCCPQESRPNHATYVESSRAQWGELAFYSQMILSVDLKKWDVPNSPSSVVPSKVDNGGELHRRQKLQRMVFCIMKLISAYSTAHPSGAATLLTLTLTLTLCLRQRSAHLPSG